MPKFPKKLLFFLFAIVLLLTIAFAYRANNVDHFVTTVHTFEECKKAGYPVLQSYPSQCTAPNGKVFIESFINETGKATSPYDQIPNH